jgi:hypothetical protein
MGRGAPAKPVNTQIGTIRSDLRGPGDSKTKSPYIFESDLKVNLFRRQPHIEVGGLYIGNPSWLAGSRPEAASIGNHSWKVSGCGQNSNYTCIRGEGIGESQWSCMREK